MGALRFLSLPLREKRSSEGGSSSISNMSPKWRHSLAIALAAGRTTPRFAKLRFCKPLVLPLLPIIGGIDCGFKEQLRSRETFLMSGSLSALNDGGSTGPMPVF